MQRPLWLFVDGSGAYGGHQVMLLRWLQELHAQDEVDAVILARAKSRLLEEALAYADHIELPKHSATPAQQRIMQVVSDLKVFIATLRGVRPQQVIIVEGCLLAQAAFTVVAWLLRMSVIIYVPLVEPARNMGFTRGKLRDWLVQHVYRYLPRAWLTITPGQAEQLRSWAGVQQPILCLPNALMPRIETSVDADRATERPGTPLRVLVLGRLDAHQKGLDTLLDYLAAHPHLSHQLQISLVGDGPFKTTIARRLDVDRTLAQWVTLRSWAPTIAIMHEHDVLLLSSRYEGVPLVVLEAMALGLPVVATDLPGIRNLLPSSCRFAVGDYDCAMKMLLATAQPVPRTELVRHNLQVVMQQASGSMFTHAVRELTALLAHLNDRPGTRLLDNSAADW